MMLGFWEMLSNHVSQARSLLNSSKNLFLSTYGRCYDSQFMVKEAKKKKIEVLTFLVHTARPSSVAE